MAKVDTTIRLGVPADKVWALIGGWFALPGWLPGIKTCASEDGGQIRRIQTADGHTIVERLRFADNLKRAYSYEILSGIDAVSNYVGTLGVADDGDGCIVTWSAEFDPVGVEDAAVAGIRNTFESGLQAIKAAFGG